MKRPIVPALLLLLGLAGVANFGCDDASPDIDCVSTEEFDSSEFSLGIRGELPVALGHRHAARRAGVHH